jgi:Fe-S-cluster containining protein
MTGARSRCKAALGPGETGMATIQRYNAGVPTPRERRVREVYDRVDDAAGRELVRLRREEGIVASCQRGCCTCCGQHIQMNPAEAHALGQYIRRTFSVRQVRGLKRRTRRWLAREDARRKGHLANDRPAGAEFSDDELSCPLLVDCACSAYPARPVICRTHFVSSDPSDCRPAQAERPSENAPVVLTSILHATQPFAEQFRADIEAAGMDFSRSILLLPHWLAMEMGWPFGSE